jgi:hypothetical protein
MCVCVCVCVCVSVCQSAVLPTSGYYLGNKMWIHRHNSCVVEPLVNNWWATVTSGFQNFASPVLQLSDHYEAMFSHVAYRYESQFLSPPQSLSKAKCSLSRKRLKAISVNLKRFPKICAMFAHIIHRSRPTVLLTHFLSNFSDI